MLPPAFLIYLLHSSRPESSGTPSISDAEFGDLDDFVQKLFDQSELKEVILKKIYESIDNEVNTFCSTKDLSIFRKSESYKDNIPFNWGDFAHEMQV